MSRALTALPLGLLALLGSACATSRMGQAEVRLARGAPCFTVTAAELRDAPGLRLQAIVVSDASARPVAEVWSLIVDTAEALPVAPDTCVRYDERPAGYSGGPARALQAGRVYEVFVNASPPRGRGSTQGYTARFCLAADTAGAPRVVQIEPGSRAWHDAACPAPGGASPR